MKKLIILAFAASMLITGCSDKKKLQETEQMAEATRAELVAAIADRDQLLELVGEISSGMEQIKQLENILSVSGSTELSDRKEQIQADITAIQKALEERREKLKAIEARLASSSKENAALKQTIETLRAQIDQQTQEILELRTNLAEAKLHIDSLGAKVDSLNVAVSTAEAQRDSTSLRNEMLTDELNICYYAIGTKDELKASHIIETGFLRKTKVLQGEFDNSFFTVDDKRTLTTLDLNSDKAEIMTNHPAGSYVISQGTGHKVLHITNPKAFWSLSNYLVIKID